MLEQSLIEILKKEFPSTNSRALGDKLGISKEMVTYYGKKFKLKKIQHLSQRKYQFNQKYFDDIGPEQAYWLGFLMADSSISGNEVSLYLSNKDRCIIENFSRCLDSNYPIKTIIGSGKNIGKEYVRVRLKSSYTINKLINYGVIPCKTGKEVFPTSCLNFKFDFLRGLLDGDGTIGLSQTKHEGCVRFFSICSSSSSFVQELKKVYGCGNIYCSKMNLYTWNIAGMDRLYELYHNLYYKQNIICLERKKKKFEELLLSMHCVWDENTKKYSKPIKFLRRNK